MDALLRRLGRAAFRRGLAGEHWAWLVLAGAAYLLRRARRPEDASTTLALEPGQRYLVRLVSPDGRRGRKGGGDAGDVGELSVTEGAGRSGPDAGDAGVPGAGT